MANPARRGGSRGRDDDGEHDRNDRQKEGYREPEGEPYDEPKEHLAIERRRFEGGLPPTPERYALAREQWYRLPGVFVRPSMDPIIGAADEAPPEDQPNPDGKAPGQ
jgi:hypothetical protein